MLGPYGETLVVDWGLAKAVGSVARIGRWPRMEATIRLSAGASSRDGSGVADRDPGLMSPEQVAGRLDRLGPGQRRLRTGGDALRPLDRPFAGRVRTTSRSSARVQCGEFAPPRSIDPMIPQPLEAICRKAMAANPEDRYDSRGAGEGRDEVARRRAGDGVSGAGSGSHRRWMRRHRTLVASTVAVLVVGLAGLARLSPPVLAAKNRELNRQSDCGLSTARPWLLTP